MKGMNTKCLSVIVGVPSSVSSSGVRSLVVLVMMVLVIMVFVTMVLFMTIMILIFIVVVTVDTADIVAVNGLPKMSIVVAIVVGSVEISKGFGLPMAPVFMDVVPVKSLVGMADISSKEFKGKSVETSKHYAALGKATVVDAAKSNG